MKRIFGLNKVAYLLCYGIDSYEVDITEDQKVYFVFPENEEVNEILLKYGEDQALHNFLAAYKRVIAKVREIKNNGGE
jgi:hypothetical protein